MLTLVVAEHVGSRLQHGVILIGVLASQRVLLVDAHVRHLLVSQRQQTVVVLLVICIGEREVRRNLDALTDVVVECDTGGETVELLLDHRTCLMVETARNTEGSLLTTTGQGEVVVLSPTHLLHLFQPVGVVVIHFILREAGVVVQFGDIARCIAQ